VVLEFDVQGADVVTLLHQDMEAAMNAPPTLPRRPKPALTMTSREFNQHTGRAKRAADKGPVVITDRGEPAYVLIKSEDYERLTGKEKFVSAIESLAQPGGPEYDFDIDLPKRRVEPVGADFGDDD
jgi:prevent-host-death family protein